MSLQKKKRVRVNLVYWNMRALVEDHESIKTWRVRLSEQRRKGSVEKMIVLMI